MSISGVLLNHPKLIVNASVPQWLVPKHYHPDNWNRRAMKGIVYPGINRDTLIAYGYQGIYHSTDRGRSFSPLMDGDFPTAARKKRTNHLFFDREFQLLLSATNDGLLQFDSDQSTWEKVQLPDNNVPVIKLIRVEDRVVAVSKSSLYISPLGSNLHFEKRIPQRSTEEEYISMIRVFLELHDGSIWGFPGKLVWDAIAIIMLFLCVSAFYVWYYPKKWKWRYKKKKRSTPLVEKKNRNFFFSYHNTLGWYASAILVVIVFTGTFLRPPLMLMIADGKIFKKYYPAIHDSNPWKYKIRNALYDSVNRKIVIDCTDGIWSGSLMENTFEKEDMPFRIFAMGATVFDEERPGTWLVGSFGGLERFIQERNEVISVLESNEPARTNRPARTMVNGYIVAPDGTEYISSHYKGVCDTQGNRVTDAFIMPEEIKKHYRMPLWNFLFELHNGRIFKGVLGKFYILVIPVGGIFGMLILITGIFDYWYLKLSRNGVRKDL